MLAQFKQSVLVHSCDTFLLDLVLELCSYEHKKLVKVMLSKKLIKVIIPKQAGKISTSAFEFFAFVQIFLHCIPFLIRQVYYNMAADMQDI